MQSPRPRAAFSIPCTARRPFEPSLLPIRPRKAKSTKGNGRAPFDAVPRNAAAAKSERPSAEFGGIAPNSAQILNRAGKPASWQNARHYSTNIITSEGQDVKGHSASGASKGVRASNIGNRGGREQSREGWRFAKQIHRPLTKSTNCQSDEKARKTRELTWTQVTAGCKCCRRWKQKLPLTLTSLLSGQFLRLRALSAL